MTFQVKIELNFCRDQTCSNWSVDILLLFISRQKRAIEKQKNYTAMLIKEINATM